MVALEAVRQEQVGVRDNRGNVTLQLAVGFRERPEPIFKTGQPRAQSWLQEREAQDAQNRESRNKILAERAKTCQRTIILGKSRYSLWSSFSKTSGQMFILYLCAHRASTVLSYTAQRSESSFMTWMKGALPTKSLPHFLTINNKNRVVTVLWKAL